MRKDKGISDNQIAEVMSTFAQGRLRSSSGKTVPKNRSDIAKAIAMSEGRAAAERGTSKRTWRGRTRIRPKLSKQ